jgi:hypothetical protein
MQSALRNQMKVLAQNPDLKLVVETNNAGTEGDKFFYVGEVYGAQLNGGQGQTGTAIGDANGYTNFYITRTKPSYSNSRCK